MSKVVFPLVNGAILGVLVCCLALLEAKGGASASPGRATTPGGATQAPVSPAPRAKDPDGPAQIMLKDPKGKKSGTLFPHHGHSKRKGKEEIKCEVCHHRLKSKDPAIRKLYRKSNRLCTHCHTHKGRKEQVSRKIAFHRQCIRCHRKARKEGKVRALTTCKQCHPPLKPAAQR